MFEVGLGLVVCVFVYVMGYAVMYNFFEISSDLTGVPKGLGRYGSFRVVREMSFDALMLAIGYLFIPTEPFGFVMYGYLVVMGSMKFYEYRIPLINAIRRKRSEDESGD